jgi:hypothetical protein
MRHACRSFPIWWSCTRLRIRASSRRLLRDGYDQQVRGHRAQPGRESAQRPDPNLRFFVDLDFTWTTFFLVTADWAGALVATFDAPDLVSAGIFDDVRTYKEGPRAALLAMLEERHPERIGINVSVHDALADT